MTTSTSQPLQYQAALTALGRLLTRWGLPADFTIHSGNATEVAGLVCTRYWGEDAKGRAAIRQCLLCLGHAETVAALTGRVSTTDYPAKLVCPVTDTPVVTACQLGSCRYHINFVAFRNCLLDYARVGELTPDRIATAFQISDSAVREMLLSGMGKMRGAALDIAVSSGDLPPSHSVVASHRLCIACEEIIAERPYYIEEEVAYCSPVCMEKLSPPEALIEVRSGLRAHEVIDWVLNSFDSIESGAQAIGFPVSVVEQIIRQRHAS